MIKNNSFYRADDVVLKAYLQGIPKEALTDIDALEISYTQEGAAWYRTIDITHDDIDTDLSFYIVLDNAETLLLLPDRPIVFQCLIKFKNGFQKHTNFASQAVKNILVEGH